MTQLPVPPDVPAGLQKLAQMSPLVREFLLKVATAFAQKVPLASTGMVGPGVFSRMPSLWCTRMRISSRR